MEHDDHHWKRFTRNCNLLVLITGMSSAPQTLSRVKPFSELEVIRKPLLYCGLLSTVWYILINIFIPLQDPSYSIRSQTVSELSAIDAPTRDLWITLCFPYTILLVAMGFGIWLTARDNRKLRIVGIVLIIDAIFGAFWPPMHLREVIAVGNGTLSDTLHVVWAYVHLVFILVAMGFAAWALNRSFRIYTIVTVLIFLVFGFLTSVEAPGISRNEPTPNIGIWERVNMLAYMLWIAVLGLVLARIFNRHSTSPAHNTLSGKK